MVAKVGDLESLVQYIYQVMSDLQYHDIFVQRNAAIKGKSNVKHEVDVYYDFVLNGQIHRVLIECKDWKKPVSKGAIKYIIDLAKLQNKDINFFMIESERAFTVEPQFIEDYFIAI